MGREAKLRHHRSDIHTAYMRYLGSMSDSE